MRLKRRAFAGRQRLKDAGYSLVVPGHRVRMLNAAEIAKFQVGISTLMNFGTPKPIPLLEAAHAQGA